ncbi:MAG: pseudouridine synthase [Lysobacteraceae bacterium]|nr:MAG: pseudouridine synthase [Xanthomonadaceae bacterium]
MLGQREVVVGVIVPIQVADLEVCPDHGGFECHWTLTGEKVGHDTALSHGSRALSDPRPDRLSALEPAPETGTASTLQLPDGHWETLLDGLCARFPRIDRAQWLDRFRRGRILDAQRQPLAADEPYRVGATVHYFREVYGEPRIPFVETILHEDPHLVVADKPHFLPVAPAGAHVRETLLTRLVLRLGNPDLVPLHRLDRGTAGLVLFSADRRTRGAYQALFRERTIEKAYEAVAPAMPEQALPLVRRSRLVAGEPFFRMCEAEGEANAVTRVEVLDAGGPWWRYALFPETGRKHQLRVHMAALGAPIRNDRYYPSLEPPSPDDFDWPLQLLARGLAFTDPLSGTPRRFESLLKLNG